MLDATETRDSETEIYICALCGRAIIARLPRGLKGKFEHLRCRRRSEDEILNASVIC